MAKRKSTRRRRTPIRVLPLLSLVSVASDMKGGGVFKSDNPIQQMADALSISVGNITGQSGRSVTRGVVTLGASGIASQAVASIAPHSKITIGRYVVRP